MPAWLVLLVQAEPLIAKMLSAAIDEIEGIEAQDKQKIKDELAAAANAATETNGSYASKAKAAFGKAQAAIDALPDDHPAKPDITAALSALGKQLADRFATPLPAPQLVK